MDAVVHFNEMMAASDPDSPPEDVQKAACDVLDETFAKLVSMVTKDPATSIRDFGMRVLNVTDVTTLDTIEGRWRTRQEHMKTFTGWLRHPAVGLLPALHLGPPAPNTPQAAYKERLDKIVGNLLLFYRSVDSDIRARKMHEPSYHPPLSEMMQHTPRVSEDEGPEITEQHTLMLWALQHLASMNAKRFEGWVMKPRNTTTGYNSTAFTRHCEIRLFFAKELVRLRDTHWALWLMFTKNKHIGDWATRMLTEHDNPEFPDLERSRSTFAFNDGVYYADEDKFRPYTAEDRRVMMNHVDLRTLTAEARAALNERRDDAERLYSLRRWDFSKSTPDTPSSAGRTPTASDVRTQYSNLMLGDEAVGRPAACKYFDMDFDYVEVDCAADVKTHECDRIWEAQDFEEDVIGWAYALMGRMMHNVGSKDGWQVAPFFKGVAGTGKSTILRVIAMFYDAEDVGVLSNNIEGKFGLAAHYKKFICICYEMRKDFGLSQAELQSMITGEEMCIAVKFQMAVSNVKWDPPLAAAGNMTASWVDTNGAMSRRWVFFEFTKSVGRPDPQLMDKIKAELPRIIQKCAKSYLEKVRAYGKRGPYSTDENGEPLCLPEYFHIQAEALKQSCNSLLSFINDSGELRLAKNRADDEDADEFYMSWKDFDMLYADYCTRRKYEHTPLNTADSYRTVFNDLEITKTMATKEDYENGYRLVTTQWVFGVKPTTARSRNKRGGGGRGGGSAGGGRGGGGGGRGGGRSSGRSRRRRDDGDDDDLDDNDDDP